MSRTVSKLVAGAVVLALASAGAHAKEGGTGKSPSKEQKIGMVSGAAVGAIVGGPFGAAVGFIVGTVSGIHAEKVRATAKKAAELEMQLATSQSELTQAQTMLAAAAEKAGQDALLLQLAKGLRGDVLFRTASAELDATSTTKLGELGGMIAKFPGLAIDIDGFADPRGKQDSNYELSQQRALAVRAALISGGANPDNIRIAAHGEQLSTAAKGDMEAYAWERRVSLSLATQAQGQVAQAQ